MFFLPKTDLMTAIKLWAQYTRLFTVQGSGENAYFAPYDAQTPEKTLMPEDYTQTVMSPKSFAFAEREELFHWEGKECIHVHNAYKHEDSRVLLVGVRPCDAYGLAYTRFFFESEFTDMHVLNKHQGLLVVTIDCEKPAAHCFCNANKNTTGPHVSTKNPEGSDVQLTPDNQRDGYWLKAHTQQGQWLLTLISTHLIYDYKEEGAQRTAQLLSECLDTFPHKHDFTTLPHALKTGFDNHLWNEISPHCIACTGCTRVCPTCTCFTTDEETHPTQHKGLRLRHWDSCQSEGFTRNAGWHNPRTFAGAVRYRIYDKLVYIEERFHYKGCTGCGRCRIVCPASIDMVKVAEQLIHESKDSPIPQEAPAVPFIRHTRPFDPSLYTPRVAEIIDIYDEAATIRRFTLRLTSGESLGTPALRGQFYMITDFGVGEVAISVPFSDNERNTLEFYIKKAGKVTSSLFTKRVGDMLGIRGPYGQAFPYEKLVGRNLLIAGSGVGYAPVRAPLLRAIENKKDFGDIIVLASALTYEELMLKEDLKAWAKIPGVRVLYALAKPTTVVDAHVGYMNDLLPNLGLDFNKTSAIVCASARRIKAVAKDLMALGMAPTNIFTALETHMRCGVGKCGHCKVGSHYMCTDGPVFTYADMLNLPPEF